MGKEPEYGVLHFHMEIDTDGKPSIFLDGEWTEYTMCTTSLLDAKTHGAVKQEGDVIVFTVDNGSARYLITKRERDVLYLKRIVWSIRKAKDGKGSKKGG